MNNEYWQPEIETMPREQLQQLQVEKLRKTIEVCLNSPFYGKRLGELGITPESIQTVEDIRKIPFAAIWKRLFVSIPPVAQRGTQQWLSIPGMILILGRI